MNILSLDGGQWASLLRLSDASAPRQGPSLVKATVTGFQAGKVLLDVGGKAVVAESRVPLKLGQELTLTLVGGKEGQVFLRPLGMPSTQVSEVTQAVLKVLQALGLPQTPLAREGALLLMENGFTLTKPALEQAMRFLKAGGDPATFLQVFQDQTLLEALPPSLMSTLGALWRKEEKNQTGKETNPAFQEMPDPEALQEHLTSSLRSKAPVLLGGLSPKEIADLIEQQNPQVLKDLLNRLPASLLKDQLEQGLSQEALRHLATQLKSEGGAPELANQARMALEQLQNLPIALVLAPRDRTEQHPVLVEVNAPKDPQDEAEIVLSLALSGLGEMEVRLRSAGPGAPVKALFRAQDSSAVRAIAADLDALKQEAQAHGVNLKPAASRLPHTNPQAAKTSLDWQI